jgi:chromosomal replication initiation ATPase DnaA
MVAEEEPWDTIRSYLSAKHSADEYTKYFGNATAHADNDKLLVSVASPELKTWIDKHCQHEIDEAAKELGLRMSVEIVVAQASAAGGGGR